MNYKEILKLYRLSKNINSFKSFTSKNNYKNHKYKFIGNFRPNVVSVEDVFFGDSGKGSVVAKLNEILQNKSRKKLVSLRYNGGGNAGHETLVNGKKVVTHQLPTGVVKEGSIAIISRGMVIHPEDLLTEISHVKKVFGGMLPGQLLIDERAVLSLDTHRALESALNSITSGGKGSTGRGIATAYSSYYERIVVTVKDLMASNWKDTFRSHYSLYKKLTTGFGKDFNLSEIQVATFGLEKGIKRYVGSERLFLERLETSRNKIKKLVSDDIYNIIKKNWQDPKVPFSLEGAQGAGLDPYHGVYPDVTASRPMSRNINDATYNVILPEQIPVRIAVMKTTYLSSVGRRVLPHQKDEKTEKWIQEAFDERGRSTGRLRDIYHISIPIAQFLKTAAGYNFIVPTHLDASKQDVPIKLVAKYIDKKTGKESSYMPYQDHLNSLQAKTVSFKGWDGDKVKIIKTPNRLPPEVLNYLWFLSQTIAPIYMTTYGPDLTDYIKW